MNRTLKLEYNICFYGITGLDSDTGEIKLNFNEIIIPFRHSHQIDEIVKEYLQCYKEFYIRHKSVNIIVFLTRYINQELLTELPSIHEVLSSFETFHSLELHWQIFKYGINDETGKWWCGH